MSAQDWVFTAAVFVGGLTIGPSIGLLWWNNS